MSGIISAKPFNNVFPTTRDNPRMQGFVTAIYEIGMLDELVRCSSRNLTLLFGSGCLFGAMSVIWFGDLFGRRKSIMIGAAIMVTGVVIQVSAYPKHGALTQFIVGRVVTGIGNGINTSTIPTYQAECSRTSNRGLSICIEGGAIAFGTPVAYWVDFGALYGPDDLTWRFPIAHVWLFHRCWDVFPTRISQMALHARAM